MTRAYRVKYVLDTGERGVLYLLAPSSIDAALQVIDQFATRLRMLCVRPQPRSES